MVYGYALKLFSLHVDIIVHGTPHPRAMLIMLRWMARSHAALVTPTPISHPQKNAASISFPCWACSLLAASYSRPICSMSSIGLSSRCCEGNFWVGEEIEETVLLCYYCFHPFMEIVSMGEEEGGYMEPVRLSDGERFPRLH